MIAIFFSARKLVVMNALPKDSKFKPEDFINNILPAMHMEKKVDARRSKSSSVFWVSMDNSTCHNEKKIVPEFERKNLTRMPYSPYSRDISPRGFWSFGMVQ
jgi:hypothetical protein